MKIELTDTEALVLSDWLHRNGKNTELFEDLAEQYVMWNIDCQLEKHLDAISPSNYAQQLAQARENVRKNY